jgi:DNA-binding phage protein
VYFEDGAQDDRLDTAVYLDSPGPILAYVEAVFEDGHPEPMAAALNAAAGARGLAHIALRARSDITS